MDEIKLNLENGFELVVKGDYKNELNYKQYLLEIFSSNGTCEIFIRKINTCRFYERKTCPIINQCGLKNCKHQ